MRALISTVKSFKKPILAHLETRVITVKVKTMLFAFTFTL